MAERRHEPVRLPHPAGGSLEGDLRFTDRPAPWAVLYVHGFGSSRKGEKAEALEVACARRGWTFAAFDFRGHGGSTGTLLELTGGGLLDDLEAVHAFLQTRGTGRLCLVGSSMGGWASAWFALRHPGAITACTFLAPALNFPDSRWAGLSEEQRRRWKETGRLRVRNQWIDVEVGYGLAEEAGRFPFARLAAEWSTPLLILHGMRDETVPFAQSLAFAEQTPYPHVELRLFRDGDHRLLRHKDAMAEAACAFFAAHAPA